jgi:hypothetical protein
LRDRRAAVAVSAALCTKDGLVGPLKGENRGLQEGGPTLFEQVLDEALAWGHKGIRIGGTGRGPGMGSQGYQDRRHWTRPWHGVTRVSG